MVFSFRLLLVMLFLAASVTLRAQVALDPLLAPHAEQYNSEIERLRALRKTQLAQVETEYVQRLDDAIKTVTDEKTLALLRKEREGVVTGLLAPANPAGLPEEAEAARKTFLNGAGKAAFDFNTEKKKVDDAYLKVLAGLTKQAKVKGAPAGLAAQVAAEKQRVAKGD